jgi:hypothetical protein
MDIDVDKIEAASVSIDAFIEHRARQKADANAEEAAWAESERRVRAKRREENRRLWIDYYGRMHHAHLGIAEGHARRRSQLLAEGGYEPDEVPDPPEAA